MSRIPEVLPTLVFAIVMLCWFGFGWILLFHRKPASAADQTRDPSSHIGFFLQVLSYALVWFWRREAFTLVAPEHPAISIAVATVAVGAAVGSVWIIMAAIETLGEEWSLTARVLEGHRLATSGPYAVVRHPIYTGMLGMLIATGLAVSPWQSILFALAAFSIGTTIRVRSEERLLSRAFGSDFEDYARRVPAIIPGLW